MKRSMSSGLGSSLKKLPTLEEEVINSCCDINVTSEHYISRPVCSWRRDTGLQTHLAAFGLN